MEKDRKKFWQEQMRIRNLQQAAGTRQASGPLAVRDMVFLADRQRDAEVAAELERLRVASERVQTLRTARVVAESERQRQWSEQRAVLWSAVIDAERAVASCEARIGGADLEDAIKAASELVVRQRRLESAQAAYSNHLNPRGFIPHAASAPL